MPERVPTCGHPDGRLPLAWSLLEIVDVINTNLAGHVDFCVLPGDNADDGTDDQYRLVRELLTHLTVPVHILPGDHDRKQGSLRAFYDVLGAVLDIAKRLSMPVSRYCVGGWRRS
jgi:3',5'-cyclic AMP phosphodiesterase CpdA